MESLWQSLGGPGQSQQPVGQSQQPVVQSQANPNMKGLQQGFPQQRGCNQGGYQESYEEGGFYLGPGGFQQHQPFGRGGGGRSQQQYRGQDGAYGSRGRQNSNNRGRGAFPPAQFVQQPQEDGNSVAQMENSLKKMLNISANNQASGVGLQEERSSSKPKTDPFIPLQVAKRAAQSKDSSESRSTHSSSREPEGENKTDSSDYSGSSGQPGEGARRGGGARGPGGRGRSSRGRGGRGGSKVKLAANFGPPME